MDLLLMIGVKNGRRMGMITLVEAEGEVGQEDEAEGVATMEVAGVVAMAMIMVMVAGAATMKSRVNTLMVNQMCIIPRQAMGVAGEEEWSRVNTLMAYQMSITLFQAVDVAGEEGSNRTNTSMVNPRSISLQAVVVAGEEGEGHGVPVAVGVVQDYIKAGACHVQALKLVLLCLIIW